MTGVDRDFSPYVSLTPQRRRHELFADKIDVAVVKGALLFAIEDGNDRAVMNAAEICAARSDVIPEDEIGTIFTSAITYFEAKGSTDCANAIWVWPGGCQAFPEGRCLRPGGCQAFPEGRRAGQGRAR
jgi:hypothetical protein